MVWYMTDLFIYCQLQDASKGGNTSTVSSQKHFICVYMCFFEKDFFYHFNSRIWKSGVQLLEDINATFLWNQWLSFSSENAFKTPFLIFSENILHRKKKNHEHFYFLVLYLHTALTKIPWHI